jgi:hypothetical protein
VDVLFLFPQKKKFQKENSRLRLTLLKLALPHWSVLPVRADAGFEVYLGSSDSFYSVHIYPIVVLRSEASTFQVDASLRSEWQNIFISLLRLLNSFG